MGDSRAHILDTYCLIRLSGTLNGCIGDLTRVRNDVAEYLVLFLESLDRKIEVAREELEAIDEELEIAEENLSAIKDRQEWDDEKKEYVPDCSREESVVERLRNRRYRCAERNREAESIVNDCKRAIDEYKQPGSAFGYSGGEGVIDNITGTYMPQAIAKLNEIYDVTQEYLKLRMGIGNKGATSMAAASFSHQSKAMRFVKGEGVVASLIDSGKSKATRFKDGEDLLKREMAQTGSAAGFFCPNCKRPRIACVCPKGNERER